MFFYAVRFQIAALFQNGIDTKQQYKVTLKGNELYLYMYWHPNYPNVNPIKKCWNQLDRTCRLNNKLLLSYICTICIFCNLNYISYYFVSYCACLLQVRKENRFVILVNLCKTYPFKLFFLVVIIYSIFIHIAVIRFH